TIPADAQTMYETVRETMVELYSNPEWDMLDKIEQFAKENLSAADFDKLPPKPTKGNLDLNGILTSTYAFL
ncbi:DNA-directed RNA polymerase, partial [Herbiconiux daphne]